mgnify:CR=1 FL=1
MEDEIDDLLNTSLDIVETPEDNLFSEEDFNNIMPSAPGNTAQVGGRVNVGGVGGFSESQFDQGATLEEIMSEDGLQRRRSNMQSGFDQFGNFLAQAVVGEIAGGTIEGLGYLLDVGSIIDVMQGDEAEWGNFITEFGQSIREGTEENTRIYEDPDAHGWSKMLDSGWWAKNSVSVASTLSMLVPTGAAMKGLGYIGKLAGKSAKISKGMAATRKAVGLAEQMGQKGKWMTNGISQAVLSRNIENWMEAHGTFEDQKNKMLNEINPETGEKFTNDEATKFASDAAANNWKMGWAMLIQDIPQYLALGRVFDPISRKMVAATTAAKSKGIISKMKPWQQKLVGAGSMFLSEGGEEAYQYMISERAKLLSDLDAGIINEKEYKEKLSEAFGDEEMMTSAFWGGLGGNLFQLAGKGVNSAFKSKDQKEYEENAGKYYSEALKNQGVQMALLQQELSNVDMQDMSPATRKHVVDTIMLNMVGTALERGKYEQFYETIEQLGSMSSEDKTQFAVENNGIEFNSELAKEYIPDVLKTADKMRKRYLKLRNQNHSAVAASKIAKIEIENTALNAKIDEKVKDIELLETGLGRTFINATENKKAKLMRDAKGLVLARRIKALKSEISSETNDYKKGMLQVALDSVLESRDQHKKDVEQARKDIKAMGPEAKKLESDKSKDNKSAETAYKTIKPEVLNAMEQQYAAEDKILINNSIVNELGTKEGKERIKKEKERREVLSNNDSTESLDKAIEDVKANDTFSQEEKDNLVSNLENEKKILQRKKEADELAAKKKAIDEELARAKAADDAKNPTKTPDNSKNTAPVKDNFEDEYSGEEVDKQKVTSSTVTKNKAEMAAEIQPTSRLLNDTTPEWKQFINDPSAPKKGIPLRWAIADEYPGITPEAKQARLDFLEAKKNGTPATQNMYDYLNIEMSLVNELDEASDVKTRIPNKQSGGKHYQNGYASNRKNAIDKMIKGETVETKIKYTQGGELNLDRSSKELGNIPENIITDLQQIKDVTGVEIVLSNEYGFLMDTQKEPSEHFPQVMLTVNNDKPYAGGVFLVVSKADGTKFPLRLNFKRNTKEESDVLADLIIDMAVPNRYGNNKQLNLISSDTMISDLENHEDPKMQDLYKRVTEVMGKEMELFNGEATVLDMIKTFVFASDEKTDLQRGLYWKSNKVHFGQGEGSVIDINNRDQMRGALSGFLENVKRRQFDLNAWNNTPGYREYVISNGILNTDASTDGPLFFDGKGQNQREIKLHIEGVKPPATPEAAPIEMDTSNKEIPQELADRMKISEDIGSVVEDDGTGDLNEYAVYVLPEGAPRSKWNKTGRISLPTYEDVLAKYQEEIYALPNKVKKAPAKEVGSEKFETRKNPAQQGNGLETKKADIEKRRQEELKQYADDIVVSREIYEMTNDEGETTYVEIRTMKDGSRKVSWGKDIKDTKNNKDVVTGVNDKISTGLTTEEYFNLSFSETSFGKPKLKTKDNSPVFNRENKINAKYDAELKALEPTPQSSDTQISTSDTKAVPLVDTAPKPAVNVRANDMIKPKKRITKRGKKASAKGLFKDTTQINENDMKKADLKDKDGKKC